MSDSKHTPGPWEILPEEAGRDYIRVRGTIPGSRFKVSNVLVTTYKGQATEAYDREIKETRANARLIAAAPELLEALIACEKSMREALYVPPSITKARAAIAKATGQEQQS